jgi:DNA-directed RNA polymerase specialized sigma24 family protein
MIDRQHAVPPKPKPDPSDVSCDSTLHVLEALQGLSPADRQVIIWRIELGYSVGEIAERLGKSKAAAGMTVSRAVQRLTRILRPEP